MKPADLREFAEKLYVTAPRHAEFAKEILENLDFVESSIEAELIEELEHQCQNADKTKIKTPAQMVEYLGERDDVLTEIETKIADGKIALKRWGLPVRAKRDADDTVDDLLNLLDDIELALNAEGLTGEILDMVAELRERKTETPYVDYDL